MGTPGSDGHAGARSSRHSNGRRRRGAGHGTYAGGWLICAPTVRCPTCAAATDHPAAVTDAAEMLRRFNAPGGIAHTSADGIAERATTDATKLTPGDAVTRFTKCAEILSATPISTPISMETVTSYPVVGSTTLAVVAEVALMEVTVHLLDLADAVGGVQPSEKALTTTRDLLIAVPDPTAAIEVLTGRAAPAAAVPAIR